MATVDFTFIVELPSFRPSSARAFVDSPMLVEDVRLDVERCLGLSPNWAFKNVRVEGTAVQLGEGEKERYNVEAFGYNKWCVRDNEAEGVYENKESSIIIFGPTFDKALTEEACKFLNQRHEGFTGFSYAHPEIDTHGDPDDLPF